MNKMPPILYVHAEAASRALHWWYGHRILVSDNRANVLRIVANTFAQDHRHVLKTTPEELRRLILEQWGEGTRYLPLGESPPLRPVVDIDGRAAMDYATRVALSTYLTSFVLEGNGRRRPSEAALVSTIDSRRLPMNAHQPASDDPMDDQLSRLSAEARDLHEEMEGAAMASARGEISESEAHARVCSALVKLQTLPAADHDALLGVVEVRVRLHQSRVQDGIEGLAQTELAMRVVEFAEELEPSSGPNLTTAEATAILRQQRTG